MRSEITRTMMRIQSRQRMSGLVGSAPRLTMIMTMMIMVLLSLLSTGHAFHTTEMPLRRLPRSHSLAGPTTFSSAPRRSGAEVVVTALNSRKGSPNGDDTGGDLFGWGQRIESLKCFVVGAIVGSFALVPFAALHDLVLKSWWEPVTTNNLAQFEFDNDMAGFQAGLFTIVYRYALRTETNNPQLNQGVVAAFVVTRTLSRVVVSPMCTAIILDCGAPLGYLNWEMIGQVAINGAESVAMFAAAASAMDYCMNKGYISRFPGK